MRWLLLLSLAACHTGSSTSMAGAQAATNLALGLGASAISRSMGGCYAVCQQGETCNEKNGLCEALPCRGKCRADESCEEGFFGLKCIPGPALSISTSTAVPAKATDPETPPAKDKPQVPDAAKP